MKNQFTKFNSQEDQNNIGLFTFYREQAQYENNINSFSLLRKNKRYTKKDYQQEQHKKINHHPKPLFNKFKQNNEEDYKRNSARQIQQQLPMSTKYIQFKATNNKNDENQQNQQKNIINRKILRGSKTKSHHKQKYGNAVIVIHSKDKQKENEKQQKSKTSPQKSKQIQNKSHIQVNNIQEMISSKNNNKYFLHGSRDNSGLIGKIPAEKHIIDLSKYLQDKSKQYMQNKKYRIPIARSFSKPQASTQNQTQQIKKSLSHQYSQSRNPAKHSYFNKLNLSLNKSQNVNNSANNGQDQNPKYIPTFSCQKLPHIMTKKMHQHEPIFYVKKYKSKKIQEAMKSNNTEIIKQIRESLKEQLITSGRNKLLVQKDKLQINTKQVKQNKQQKQIMKVSISLQKQGQQTQKKQKQPQQSTLNDKLDAKQRKIIELLKQSHIIKS